MTSRKQQSSRDVPGVHFSRTTDIYQSGLTRRLLEDCIKVLPTARLQKIKKYCRFRDATAFFPTEAPHQQPFHRLTYCFQIKEGLCICLSSEHTLHRSTCNQLCLEEDLFITRAKHFVFCQVFWYSSWTCGKAQRVSHALQIRLAIARW